METIKMVKPKKLASAHWIFGINVKNKEVVDIPKHLVSEFRKLGFEIFSLKTKAEKLRIKEG